MAKLGCHSSAISTPARTSSGRHDRRDAGSRAPIHSTRSRAYARALDSSSSPSARRVRRSARPRAYRFFDDSRLFRVHPGYVAQFGIAGEPAVNKEWLLPKEKRLLDEPRTTTNARGTLSFASGGKNTRTTQIYVNLGDNGGLPNMLDAQGFVPFARVTRGMDLVDKAYSGYGLVESLTGGLGGSVNQGKAIYYGNAYLDEVYPKLTRISSIKRAK